MSRANTTALVGNAALVRVVRPRLLLCDKLYRLRIQDRILNREFLELFFRTPVGRFEFERGATGASGSMQNISQESVRNLWLALPPLAEQEAIVISMREALTRTQELVASTRKTLKLLQERRDSVITAAVTGLLDVEAA